MISRLWHLVGSGWPLNMLPSPGAVCLGAHICLVCWILQSMYILNHCMKSRPSNERASSFLPGFILHGFLTKSVRFFHFLSLLYFCVKLLRVYLSSSNRIARIHWHILGILLQQSIHGRRPGTKQEVTLLVFCYIKYVGLKGGKVAFCVKFPAHPASQNFKPAVSYKALSCTKLSDSHIFQCNPMLWCKAFVDSLGSWR